MSNSLGADLPVAAVVVTYRRPRLAGEVVRGLIESEGLAPDRVVLVINGEGGLDDPELQAKIEVVHLRENIGPAGGFREGVRAASAIPGVRWCYLCEDDVALFDLPSPRLARLVGDAEAIAGSSPSPIGAIVAYGRDLHRLTGHTTLHEVSSDHGYDEVDATSWGASLVSTAVLEQAVLPDDGYFFEFEDFDFWYQLRRAGFRILLDRSSAAAVASQMSLAGREAAIRGRRPVDADEPWRAFYVARNYFRLSRRHGSPTWILAHLGYSLRRLQLASSGAERAAILHGLLAGVRGASGRDDRYVRTRGELIAAPAGGGSPPVRLAGSPRRVLHVLPCDIARGAQVFARDLCAALNEGPDDHQVLTLFRAPVAVLPDATCLGVPMGASRSLGFEPRVMAPLRRAVRRLRPDVIVAHGSESLKYLACLPGPLPPVVYLAIGMAIEPAHHGARRLLHQLLLARAEVVAAVSSETLREAEHVFKVSPRRTVLLPNGRDPARFRPREGHDVPGEVVRVLFVGYLDAQKDPLRFVSALTTLARRGRPVRGVVVGDGPLRDEVRRAAESSSCIEVLGQRSDIPELLREADVFVFCSRPPEGMPGVLIEAAMSALPIVATAVPGVSEVVTDQVTGLVVPLGDQSALVEALDRVVADPDLRLEMGAAARRDAEGAFSLARVAHAWDTLLDDVTRRRAAASTGWPPAEGGRDELPAGQGR